MPSAVVHFTELAGVPVTYAGRQISMARGSLLEPFYDSLSAALTRMWELCPSGQAEAIFTGGIRGDSRSGLRHQQGRAFDLNGIRWAGQLDLLAHRAPDDPRRYLAAEACLRMFHGQVLNWWYNRSHRSHWHIDDKHPPGWRPRRSVVVFAQAACKYVHSSPGLIVDGVPGVRTYAAMRAVTSEVGAGLPVTDPAGWRAFLLATALVGFGQVEAV